MKTNPKDMWQKDWSAERRQDALLFIKEAGIYRPGERTDQQLARDIRLTKKNLDPEVTASRRKSEAALGGVIGAAGGLMNNKSLPGALAGLTLGGALGYAITPTLQGERLGRRGALRRMERETAKRGKSKKGLSKSASEADEKVKANREKAMAAGSAVLAKKSLKGSRGDLTGREALYHGTSAEGREAILGKGLQSRKQRGVGDADSLTAAVASSDVNKKSKDLVFTTADKGMAQQYALQDRYARTLADQEGIPFNDAMKRVMTPGTRDNMAMQAGSLKNQLTPFDFLKNKGDTENAVKFDVPLWKLRNQEKVVTNPEIAGILSEPMRDFANKAMLGEKRYAKHLDKLLGEGGGTRAIQGGLGTEYLPGHADYKKLDLAELGDYASSNKGRFAKGVGKSIGGLGLGAFAVKNIADIYKRNKAKKGINKSASVRGKILAGSTALGALALGGNEYLKSRTDPKTGISRRAAAREARMAQDRTYEQITGKKRNPLVRKGEGALENLGQKMDNNKNIAIPATAIAGGSIAGLSAKKALDFIKANARNL